MFVLASGPSHQVPVDVEQHVGGLRRAESPVVGANDDPRLNTATIYSTLEPCSQRKSRPRACTQLILAAGIPRVVMAWREPSLFVADCQGYEMLTDAGVAVVEIPDLAQEAKAPDTHLSLGPP